MNLRIEDDKLVVKLILAGDGAVGKTTLVNRFVSGGFVSGYQATIGVDITSKEITEKQITIRIWDVAGQSLFSGFRQQFYIGAQGAFLVFDLTIPKSLDSLHSWIEEIEETVGKMPIVLLGNKADLNKLYSVSADDIAKFLAQHPNIATYLPTSAISGINVEKAFRELLFLIKT
ncbi:MAG: GTP-binding protein [Candidatus Hodarchaeales archaeon]|jgi:small GTP-binding protein